MEALPTVNSFTGSQGTPGYARFKPLNGQPNRWPNDGRALKQLKDANSRQPKLRKLGVTTVYAYSAFLDLRDGNMGNKKIRIISISNGIQILLCQFSIEGREPLQTPVHWYTTAENHNRPYKVGKYFQIVHVQLGESWRHSAVLKKGKISSK